MSLRIQNNVEAFNAHRQLVGTSGKLAKSMERLASGYRINRAADDAAGLAISEKLRAQIGGVAQSQRNAQDAVSRATLDEFGVEPGEFFDPRLVVWYQDTDLLQRLRLAGRPPRLVQEAQIRHGLSQTVATDDPALRAWIDQRIALDKAAFEAKHGLDVAGAAR